MASLQFCEALGQSFDQGIVICDLLAQLRHQRGLLVALAAQLVDFVLELVGGRMFVISGGPTPGASASTANEIFTP